MQKTGVTLALPFLNITVIIGIIGGKSREKGTRLSNKRVLFVWKARAKMLYYLKIP